MKEGAMRKILLLTAALSLAWPASAPAQTAPSATSKTWDFVSGNWKRLKGSVKRQWGKLTQDDIAEANGRRDVLAGKIQARYGIDKAKADAQIDEWLKTRR
jgi:uncharacterized protein YjbJ (UPF0337 family)